jgi:hypothetical protein
MAGAADHLPDDTEALRAALIETRAKLSGAEALITHLQLVIAKMRREKFGPHSERSRRLIDQLELQLEELSAAAGEDEAKAEAARVHVGFTRRQPARRNLPAELPRRRIVYPVPTSCPCCGGSKLSKIGEDITETLDVVPRQWFVTEHVREKFSCRSCETITQPPAPFHAIARGFAGPSLLAMILVEICRCRPWRTMSAPARPPCCRSTSSSRRMCSPQSASMVTTPLCRCLPR